MACITKTGRSRISAPAGLPPKDDGLRLRYPPAVVGCVIVHRLRADSSGSRPFFDHQLPFLAGAMQFAVMRATQRHREFIADLLR